MNRITYARADFYAWKYKIGGNAFKDINLNFPQTLQSLRMFICSVSNCIFDVGVTWMEI